MSHANDKLKFGVPADAVVMDCPADVNPDDDSVRYYGGLLVCESASTEWRRRIVAAVNACAGSSTEWLEFSVSEDCADLAGPFEPLETRINSILKTGLAYMVERDQLRKQRDELMSVLVNVRNCLESACEIGDGPIVDTIWYGPSQTLFEYMDSVILGDQGNPVIQESLITETPALIFYPAGSLGEEVES